ncbi:MAG TPA: hypothetical protein ENN41_06815 [Sediminispirochaeta sp.]|nr:hypothetical protein [Sediminispirochaeta sp.]
MIEQLTGMELRTSSKNLLLNYLKESHHPLLIERARYTIVRYLQDDIPSLQEIQVKSRYEELDAVDHLILKLEYEAKCLQDKK